MKKYILLFLIVCFCLLSFTACRDDLTGLSSSLSDLPWPPATTASTTAPDTATTATTQTTENTTSHPIIKKTEMKTTAQPATLATKPVTQKPTEKPTAAPTTLATAPEGDVRQQVFSLVNDERAKVGAAALVYRNDVQAAADLRAGEIIDAFSHTRPNGQECFTALDEAGVRYYTAGENVAFGQSTAAAVMAAWMNSEGHKLNILREEFTGIAVGHTERNGVHYWVQFFVA